METEFNAPNEAEVVHTINRLPEGALDHDRRTALQVRALLNLIASEVI